MAITLKLWNDSRRQRRLQWRKSGFPSGRLALFISSFHRNTGVWSGGIDRALVVGAEEPARSICTAGNDDRPANIFAEGFCDLFYRLGCPMWVGLDQPRLTQKVEFVRLDYETSLATCAAIVAFVLWHG